MLWKQTSDVMETLPGEGCTKEAGPPSWAPCPKACTHPPSLTAVCDTPVRDTRHKPHSTCMRADTRGVMTTLDYTVGAGMQAEKGVGSTEYKPNLHQHVGSAPCLWRRGNQCSTPRRDPLQHTCAQPAAVACPVSATMGLGLSSTCTHARMCAATQRVTRHPALFRL